MVEVEDRVGAPQPVPVERMRDSWLPLASRYTLWLTQVDPWRVRLGPITLLEFDEPQLDNDSVRWPIRGGLLAARAGGWIGFRWRDGELTGRLEGYAPWLPRPLYDLTQLLVHHAVTRLTLLQLRGRTPLPGEPAGRQSRLLAAALDLALCAVLARGRPRRLAGLYAGYHLAAWTLAGTTLGGALAGTRVLAVDGSRVTLPQALVRLLAGDQAAGTAVVKVRG